MIVVDTNVWISALIFGKPGNVPARAIRKAVTEDTLATSLDMLHELRRILSQKYGWPVGRISTQLEQFFSDALIVTLQHNVHICRDPKDNMFLECAALSSADVILTGDKDLLTLCSYAGASILTPSQYIELPA